MWYFLFFNKHFKMTVPSSFSSNEYKLTCKQKYIELKLINVSTIYLFLSTNDSLIYHFSLLDSYLSIIRIYGFFVNVKRKKPKIIKDVGYSYRCN